jgi:hypothetical protein
MEGRPPGEIFAHQRWDEFFPQAGYILSLAQVAEETRFCGDGNWAAQGTGSVWTYGAGRCGYGARGGTLPPFLIKARYGEPVLTRIYNELPDDPDHLNNSGFGRNESQLHFHNAHNGAESDGAANVHHFRAPSTTTAGAPPWPAGTRSTPRRPTAVPPAPMERAAWSTSPAISANSRARCGRMTTASSSRPRMSTRAISVW